MTYIDMVNKLLVRLRERKVETIEETTYSALLGSIINDSMQLVESNWNWSALRTTLQATTTSGTFNYVLTGAKNNLTILDVINSTDNFFMGYKTSSEYNELFMHHPDTNSPRYYSFNGVDSNGDTQVDLYPVPDDAYVINFNVIARSGDLVNDADNIVIPNLPIELLAYAMAVEERGEDGGQTSVSAHTVANAALVDAIALDAGKHPEELIWEEV